MEYTFSNRIKTIKASAIREIFKLTADPAVISFAAGNPSPDSFPVDAIAEITADIFKNEPVEALQYNITEGYLPLRNYLKETLLPKFHSYDPERDDVLVVTGGQQGIDLACKVLCNEGDTVLCENPSFVGALNAIKAYNTNLVGIDLESDGINLEQLEQALKTEKNVKLLYIIPTFQNPSGITTSLEKRKAVYELCKQYGVLILEDNPYGMLRFDGEDIPTIKSMDTEGIVIYDGSFSKVLSPGMRIGFISLPKEIAAKVTVAKQVNDVHTNILAQMICHRFVTKYDFDAHVDRLRALYRQKCHFMLEMLDRYFDPRVTFTRPQGGLFIWGTLPDEVDMMQFCRDAVAKKVAVVPGSAFLPHEETMVSRSFRMNFSMPSDEQIEKGVKILGEMTHSL
ncbi:MAG: PLP-dependent aminotransferase family protein [Clostridiales bacterium]|nr:MAG: PLP-dependent aminotransferase family protein [Clostridiales bacterium]